MKIISSVAAFAAGLACAGAAGAEQITFGPSGVAYSFLGDGAGDITLTAGALTGPAFDTTDPSHLGTFTFSPLSLTLTPIGLGLYSPGANSFTFSYDNGNGDTLRERDTITAVQDDTSQPKFFFTGTIDASSGNPAFLAAFPAGGAAQGDWISTPMYCSNAADCATLTALGETQTSAHSYLSSGEKIPGTTAVPEPSAASLLFTALVSVAAAFGLIRYGERTA